MGIVAISPPDVRTFETAFLENRARSTQLSRMPHFCLGAVMRAKTSGLQEHVIEQERTHMRYGGHRRNWTSEEPRQQL
jgi:hypothetical protein